LNELDCGADYRSTWARAGNRQYSI